MFGQNCGFCWTGNFSNCLNLVCTGFIGFKSGFRLRRTDRKSLRVTAALPLSRVSSSVGYFLSESVKPSVFQFTRGACRRRSALQSNLCFFSLQCFKLFLPFHSFSSQTSMCLCVCARAPMCVCCARPWRCCCCFFSPPSRSFCPFFPVPCCHPSSGISVLLPISCAARLCFPTLRVCVCVWIHLHCCVSGAALSFSAQQHFCPFCPALSHLPPCLFWLTVCDSTRVCIISPDDFWII